MISVEQVKLYFGGFELFKGISFIVNPKDRIGLVGKNGAGKSTLLKTFARIQEPSEGAVIIPKDVTIGYLPQTMLINDTQSVIKETEKAFESILSLQKKIDYLNSQLATRTDYESEEYAELIQDTTDSTEHFNLLGGHNYHAKIEQTLLGLGFRRSDFDRPTSEFSGGWRMRIELAKLLLMEPDVFLLDEPTNHLDIESIQWLEDFLKNYNGAVVLVSHDRAFLDNVTNRTVEISLGRIYDYKANYTKYVELREERREQQKAAYTNQQKQIQETEAFISRFRYQATKAVQVQSRIKQLDKLERIEIDEEDNARLNIKFPPAPRSGRIVAEIKELSKFYGQLQVLDKIDLYVEQGEKIAFVGKNGEGKTTLARIIVDNLPYEGHLKIGHNVKVGYFAQNQADLLDESLSIFDTIDQVAVGDVRTKIRDILGAFMFSGEAVDKKVKVLSGGERTRLAMVKLMLEPVNFLVLDEPTNHLDMRSKEILKNALKSFDGSVMVISHDREFLDGLVDCVYEFADKKIIQHLGGVYDFLEKKRIENIKQWESNKKIEEKVVKKATPKENSEISFEAKKEINRQIARVEKLISSSESSISKLEAQIESMDTILAQPTNPDPELFDKYEDTKKELETVLEKWEDHHLELEEWESKKNW